MPQITCVQYWTEPTLKKTAWCALKPSTKLDKTATSDATACGQTVMLRIGSGKRMPTCQECIKALTETKP